VLEYNTPFATFVGTPLAGQSANRVWGQGNDFAGFDCNSGGIGATTLCFPRGGRIRPPHITSILRIPATAGYSNIHTASVDSRRRPRAKAFGVDGTGTNFTTKAGCPNPASSISMCKPQGGRAG